MIIIIQPYCFWEGHYLNYFKSFSSDKFYKIYCNTNNLNLKNSIYLKSLFNNYNRNIFFFILSRIFNYLQIVLKLRFSKAISKKYYNIYHFLEFEPLSILIFLLLNIFKKKKIIITLHSIDPNYRQNIFHNFIIIIQRIIHKSTLILLNFVNATIVVHSQVHKLKIKKIFKKNVDVIEYPAEDNFINHKKKNIRKRKILFFGLIRKDKGIFDFINDINLKKYKLDIIGKVLFKNILKINKKNIKIKNVYLKESKIKNVFLKYDFLLLPYKKNYPGSAGPLFLALSYGLPVICSDLEIFRYFLRKYKVGYIFNQNKFEEQIDKISNKQYKKFIYNGIKYCKDNNWNNLIFKYEKIYEKFSINQYP